MTPQNPVLLLVDDDPLVRQVVGRFGAEAGYDVVSCAGGTQALDQLQRRPAFALVDLRMPDVDGLQVLRAVRERVPTCEMVLMSGEATIEEAVEAVQLGAIDYLRKPLDFDRLRRLLVTVREEAARRRSLLAIESDVAHRLEFCGMLGRSSAMQQIFSLVRRLAPHVRHVLICGETGTGKELAARAFHRLGPRSQQRFVAVNCSAVVETLSESELFGHVRGAFTGATENRIGLFEMADKGTLFLDEIGELPLALQAKLLRVLETGEIQRVGAVERRRVDVNVIAATNRNLRTEIASGRFRTDLFYRLNVIEVTLPPLREHREDIPYLTAAFVREFATRLSKPLTGISTEAERTLFNAYWEGNVRELRNAVERACILAEGDLITERELVGVATPPVRAAVSVSVAASQSEVPVAAASAPPEQEQDQFGLKTVERDHIVRVLERSRGNKKAAAELLGISRRKLYRYLEEYHLHIPQKALQVDDTAPLQNTTRH
ncbi:MAG: sigma-54 dependent transcriptional regulator [Acidobacteria bacterium]|nr:sigma-54 dependent transcriptional regulator [Acidobacteriota bacterium]